MSDNWVVQNLENALTTWNEKPAEIWACGNIVTTGQTVEKAQKYGVIANQPALHCGMIATGNHRKL